MKAPRILVVDDQDQILDLVAGALAGDGFEVVTARSGYEALVAVDRGDFGLVIADVMMPRLSGLDLLRAMRGNPRTRAVPFILISAVDRPEAIERALAMGADDYITKPFRVNEILGKVRHRLRPPAGDGDA